MKTNLKFTLPMLAIAATGTLYSCADKEEIINNTEEIEQVGSEKELISFTSEGGGVITRASGFGGSANTQIVMRIKSEDSRTTPGTTRYTRTVASATPTCSSTHEVALTGTHSDVNFTGNQQRYWDDAYGRFAKLSVYAVAVPGFSADAVLDPGILQDGANGSFVNDTQWFTEATENETFTWTLPKDAQTADVVNKKDICYSNNIRLSTSEYTISDTEKGVYRPGYSTGSSAWSWTLEKGQMQWNAQTTGSTTGKFDKGHLVFYHALSKITINLKEASNEGGNKGFDNTKNTDFKFKDGTNVKLLNFPYENKFDLATGKWGDYSADACKKDNIAKLYETTTGTPDNITTHTLVGLVVPGKDLFTDTNNSLSFIIDDNEYFVTGKQIAEAIREYYKVGGQHENDNNAASYRVFTTMKQGEHYVINITVAKSKIDAMTAQLVDWETVTADISEPSNAYVNIQVEERTNTSQYDKYVTDEYTFDFYRAAYTASDIQINDNANGVNNYDWKTGYVASTTSVDSDKATKTYDNTDKKWSTNWVWPDNKTFYHFRMVGNTEGTSTSPSGVTVNKNSDGDYFEITSGKITGSTYKDYTWGAPFKRNSGNKWDYDTTYGFDGKNPSSNHQIYKAIGATNDKINLMMFHMTSQIFLKVKTTTSDDKVVLHTDAKETKVELLSFYKNGTVLLGNGLVKPTETDALTENDDFEFDAYTAQTTEAPAFSTFKYGVVPQALSGTKNSSAYTIGIRITTPDGNQYVVKDISQVLAASGDITSNNLNIPYEKGTGENASKYVINRWYPGYQYTYTVTIKKTGIVNITAQLVDWETVTGNLGEITLEN